MCINRNILVCMFVIRCMFRAYRDEKMALDHWNWNHSCELPCGSWKLNLILLEEQPVLFITEPFLQLRNLILYVFYIF